jgi:hypothetical protein
VKALLLVVLVAGTAHAESKADKLFAKGKKLLAQKKAINYEGASSAIDFDDENDVDPTFAAFVIRAGKWQRAYAING